MLLMLLMMFAGYFIGLKYTMVSMDVMYKRNAMQCNSLVETTVVVVGLPASCFKVVVAFRNDKDVCENFTFGGLWPINSHHIIDLVDGVFWYDMFIKTQYDVL